MIKKRYFLFLITIFLLLSVSKVEAAEVFINPATGSIEQETFTTALTLDPQSDTDIQNIHIYLKYDPLLLKVQSVNKGELSNYTALTFNEDSGIVEIQANDANIGNQIINLANINFTVLTKTGFIDLQVLNTSTYKSEITDSSNLNLLTNYPTASLLIDIQDTTTQQTTNTVLTQESSNSIVPSTGYSNNFVYILISVALLSTGFFSSKYVKSKR